jgi:hypothetical protein
MKRIRQGKKDNKPHELNPNLEKKAWIFLCLKAQYLAVLVGFLIGGVLWMTGL